MDEGSIRLLDDIALKWLSVAFLMGQKSENSWKIQELCFGAKIGLNKEVNYLPSYLKCSGCESLFYTATDLDDLEGKNCQKCNGKLEKIGKEKWETLAKEKQKLATKSYPKY